MANPIPKKLLQEVMERDEGLCQHCFGMGSHPHHIVPAGMGRMRTHRIENLVTLCFSCHSRTHSEKSMREWCYEWSRERYGEVVDKLLSEKWSDTK